MKDDSGIFLCFVAERRVGELSGSIGQCNGALARDLLLGDTEKIDS